MAASGAAQQLIVDYCGETYTVEAGKPFVVGREGDLVVDDNPYLHRQFLRVEHAKDLWWITNVGGGITATVADAEGLMQAWLAPGAQLPLVFPKAKVWFSAGPTTYEFDLLLEEASFSPAALTAEPRTSDTTIGRPRLTVEQHLMLLALAEPALRAGASGGGRLPSNAEAAARLGWTITKFNRKLDNVCQKFERLGVRGLHGGNDKLASTRRGRLVEYALATRLVAVEELRLIEQAKGTVAS